MVKYLRMALVLVVVTATPVLASARTILVLGDSISSDYGIPLEAGWVNLLQERLEQHYPARYKVVNASISGETTAGGLRRLPALLEEHDPARVVVELGGNDGLRGMSPAHMERNLREIIEISREAGASVTLLSIELPPSYGVFFNRRFTGVFNRLEEELAVDRVSLGYDLLNDRDLLQSDGIHPTADAQPLLLERIWPAIDPG